MDSTVGNKKYPVMDCGRYSSRMMRKLKLKTKKKRILLYMLEYTNTQYLKRYETVLTKNVSLFYLNYFYLNNNLLK